MPVLPKPKFIIISSPVFKSILISGNISIILYNVVFSFVLPKLTIV